MDKTEPIRSVTQTSLIEIDNKCNSRAIISLEFLEKTNGKKYSLRIDPKKTTQLMK